jgi:hypothetical protein
MKYIEQDNVCVTHRLMLIVRLSMNIIDRDTNSKRDEHDAYHSFALAKYDPIGR